MQTNTFFKIFIPISFALSLLFANRTSAQSPTVGRFKVEGGILTEVLPTAEEDSLSFVILQEKMIADSLAKVADSLTKREMKRLKRDLEDSTLLRQSRYFRDSIPLSTMCWISTVVPGFGQLYNEQVWKIPILYSTLGVTLAGSLIQNKKYKSYKTQYDALKLQGASREELDPVQNNMIKYNTRRQLLFGTLAASYLYFIGDGAINYKGENSNIKKATTLSTIFPGAGQIYNKSYWKVPIVLGGIATFAYVIDFNARGYTRFKLAYELLTDGDDSTVDEFGGIYSATFLDNYRDSYRRNRDLGIILMAGWYLLNIIDAHVDAHFKNYDISDDLSINLVPVMGNFYTQRGGSATSYGMSLNITF